MRTPAYDKNYTDMLNSYKPPIENKEHVDNLVDTNEETNPKVTKQTIDDWLTNNKSNSIIINGVLSRQTFIGTQILCVGVQKSIPGIIWQDFTDPNNPEFKKIASQGIIFKPDQSGELSNYTLPVVLHPVSYSDSVMKTSYLITKFELEHHQVNTTTTTTKFEVDDGKIVVLPTNIELDNKFLTDESTGKKNKPDFFLSIYFKVPDNIEKIRQGTFFINNSQTIFAGPWVLYSLQTGNSLTIVSENARKGDSYFLVQNGVWKHSKSNWLRKTCDSSNLPILFATKWLDLKEEPMESLRKKIVELQTQSKELENIVADKKTEVEKQSVELKTQTTNINKLRDISNKNDILLSEFSDKLTEIHSKISEQVTSQLTKLKSEQALEKKTKIDKLIANKIQIDQLAGRIIRLKEEYTSIKPKDSLEIDAQISAFIKQNSENEKESNKIESEKKIQPIAISMMLQTAIQNSEDICKIEEDIISATNANLKLLDENSYIVNGLTDAPVEYPIDRNLKCNIPKHNMNRVTTLFDSIKNVEMQKELAKLWTSGLFRDKLLPLLSTDSKQKFKTELAKNLKILATDARA